MGVEATEEKEDGQGGRMAVEVKPRLIKSQNQTTPAGIHTEAAHTAVPWKTDSRIVDLDMLDTTVIEAMVVGVGVVQLAVVVVTMLEVAVEEDMLVLSACLVNYWLELDYLI